MGVLLPTLNQGAGDVSVYTTKINVDKKCVSRNETCLDENAHCVNTVGNFSCQCDPGFTGDGYSCSS